MRNLLKEVLTSKVPHFRESAGVRCHMLSFNVEEVEIEMTVDLVIHLHDQSLGPMMAKVKHRTSEEVQCEEV